MEISASTNSAPAVSSRLQEVNGRLAALRALQQAIDTAQDKFEAPAPAEDGKGQLLDLRC